MDASGDDRYWYLYLLQGVDGGYLLQGVLGVALYLYLWYTVVDR